MMRCPSKRELFTQLSGDWKARVHLESKGLLDAEWDLSENNRKAMFYIVSPGYLKARR